MTTAWNETLAKLPLEGEEDSLGVAADLDPQLDRSRGSGHAGSSRMW